MEPYDFDTMVIGGGPAGMSAAIRARWLRTYYCLPSDIAIVDKNGLGGISNWKAVIVGTPSWQYVGSQLEDLFRQDFNTFPVEIIHSNARRLEKKGGFWEVEVGEKRYRCLSVIICTGLKMCANEREFIGKGLVPTLKDHKFIEDSLRDLCLRQAGKRAVVLGSPAVLKLWSFFQKINQGRMEAQLVVEPPFDHNSLPSGARIGRMVKINGSQQVETIDLEVDGQILTIDTDFLILDFESYMARTNSADFLTEMEMEAGFVKVNRQMATNQEGIFAAGDITGGPFCVAKAVGEGVSAGFAVYNYNFQKKFGLEPNLYAFFAHSGPEIDPPKTGFFIPDLQDSFKPKLLNRIENLSGHDPDMLKLFDGKTDLETIKEKFSHPQVEKTIRTLIMAKQLTIHP